MFVIYTLIYLLFAVPILAAALSWYYTGKPTMCWGLRPAEQLELLRVTLHLALRVGFAVLVLFYSVQVIWHYLMLRAGEITPSEVEVKRIVFQGYTLIFSIPAFCWGIYWILKMRHAVRQFFGYERPQFFNPGNS